MEMTIDEAIISLERDIHNARLSGHQIDQYKVAIDTMRKYQKIQEIVKWNNAPSPYYKPDGQLFREIIEVLESEETNDNM